jgi:hypothetical protein
LLGGAALKESSGRGLKARLKFNPYTVILKFQFMFPWTAAGTRRCFCRGTAVAGMDCRSRETGTDAIYGELADAIAYWLWPAREGLRGLMAGESLLTLEISIAEERSDSSSIESLLSRPDSPQPDAKSEQERNEQIERVAPPGVPSRERWAAGAGFWSTDGAVATGRPEAGQLFAPDRAYWQNRCFVPSVRVTGRRALCFDPRRGRE